MFSEDYKANKTFLRLKGLKEKDVIDTCTERRAADGFV
jgi:hypothetical protein